MSRLRVAFAIGLVCVAGPSVERATAAPSDPPLPARIEAALVRPVDAMLEREYETPQLVRGTRREPNPRCTVPSVGDKPQRSATCRLRTTTVGTWWVLGDLRPGRCRWPHVDGDFTLQVTVRKQSGQRWCYHGGAF